MARTQFSGWQINPTDRNDGTMKYVELAYVTASHTANDIVTYEIPLGENVEGLNIKTIRVKSQEPIGFIIEMLDGLYGETIYETFQEAGYHYDQVDIPYKPAAAKSLFLRLHNRGSLTTKFDILIKGIEVI